MLPVGETTSSRFRPSSTRPRHGSGYCIWWTRMDLAYLTIKEAAALLERRELTSVELTRAALERIDWLDPGLRAFLLVTPDVALAQAREADAAIERGEAGPLTGVPMAL